MNLLTPDDVLRERFPRTKFREGYDQDAVDDFLDLVVNSMSHLIQRAEEAEKRAEEAEKRAEEAERKLSAPSASSSASPEVCLDGEPTGASNFRRESIFQP